MVSCEESRVPESKACRHFYADSRLPPDMQKMRLLAQALNENQRAMLKWSIEQADIMVGVQDSRKEALQVGDVVSFVFDNVLYAGLVDGIDPKTLSVNVFCLAFPKASIFLHGSSLTKRTDDTTPYGEMTDYAEGTAEWHLECLAEQIANLRASEESSPKKFQELLAYQKRWNEADARVRFSVAVKANR